MKKITTSNQNEDFLKLYRTALLIEIDKDIYPQGEYQITTYSDSGGYWFNIAFGYKLEHPDMETINAIGLRTHLYNKDISKEKFIWNAKNKKTNFIPKEIEKLLQKIKNKKNKLEQLYLNKISNNH